MRFAVSVAFVLALALTPEVGLAKGKGGGGNTPPPPPPPSGPSVSSLVLSPNSVTGGAATSGTVTLSGAAPAGGANVVLGSSDTTVATVPASMTVAAGATSGTFTVTSRSVPAVTLVTITADYGGLGTGAILQVNAPAGTGGNGVLSGFSISPDTVIGGNPATGTVTLTAPVTGPTTVTLTSTDTTVATVPGSVSVPGGATSATFTITTRPQTGTGTFSWITAATATASFGASMNVNPGPPANAPSVVSVTLAPASTGGGGASTGTIHLSGPANDGGGFTLTSSNPAVVQVPAEVVVVARQATAAFPVTTTVVGAQTSVTITATSFSGTQLGSRSAVMTVTTAPPPPPDVVGITNGSWQACIIKISATSTNPNAILTLVLADSNSPMFTLDNLGGGRYSGTRAWRPPGTNVPVNLAVRSNFGGQARITLADPQGFVCRADL